MHTAHVIEIMQSSLQMAMALPTLVFFFMGAEWVRYNALRRVLPGDADYRLAATVALLMLVCNILSVLVSEVGVTELGTPMDPDMEMVVFMLVVHPVWWVSRLCWGPVMEVLDSLYPGWRPARVRQWGGGRR